MRGRIILGLLSLLLASSCVRAQADGDDARIVNRAAVLAQNRLVCLADDGRFLVWDKQGRAFDAAWSRKLERKGLTHLATDSEVLWAADATSLVSWSAEEGAWKTVAKFDRETGSPQALAVVGEIPLLVYETKVFSPSTGQTYEITKEVRESDGVLRVLATFTSDTMLWIGTGRGEWGGSLIGLDPKTSQWDLYSDATHYVTGITRSGSGDLLVSWSMSHFGANTLIRLHGPDAKPKKSYPELSDQYYQRIVFNSFDKTLYGIERTGLVSIKAGRPSRIAKLMFPLYRREAMAIGVAPGAVGLFPTGAKTLLIVPPLGLPWQIEGKTLRRLPGP